MGAESWPALSESTKISAKFTADGSPSTSQVLFYYFP
jgi:hypothetical protein